MKISILFGLFVFACVSSGAEMQTWTLADGTEFDAKYKAVVMQNVIMESSAGKQKKIAMNRFSEADIEFFQLENPPELRIDFRKISSKESYRTRFILQNMPVVLLYTFGVRVEKRSAGAYDHELKIEYFAIAAQRGFNNKYILLDHQTVSFLPSNENNYLLEAWSPRVAEIDEYFFSDVEPRGKKYDSYLIIVTDKRDEVIAVKTEKKWLIDNVENLRELSVGNYMDKNCKRVFPGSPKSTRY